MVSGLNREAFRGCRPVFCNPFPHASCDRFGHHFGAPGSGIQVATSAGLSALAAHIDLEAGRTGAMQGQMMLRRFAGAAIDLSGGLHLLVRVASGPGDFRAGLI
jgi:hypothetical protein